MSDRDDLQPMRDPRADPRPGDTLRARGRWVSVHYVDRGQVYYATGRDGADMGDAAYRMPLDQWRAAAVEAEGFTSAQETGP